jgi:hypothetical protein
MSVPGRLHITWQNDTTLKVDTDAGLQTRLLQFGNVQTPASAAASAGKPPEARTWQGVSEAQWLMPRPNVPLQLRPADRTADAPPLRPTGGSLRVVTTNLRAGYLRKNGVPYSENAVLTEHWDLYKRPNGEEWLTITTQIEDPRYLSNVRLIAPVFKKEPNGSKWDPTPCSASGEMTFEKPGIAALMIMVVMLSAVPVAAQVDLTGTWQRVGGNDNGAAQEPVDLLGMPLSADGRAKALSYDIACPLATERQCQMYPPMYAIVGPFPLQFTMVPDPITQKLLAWKIAGWGDRDETVIWMDGRPHPSKIAPHSHGGFTTGAWEGDTLTAVTTHFKLGDIKRHRGFSSDRATMSYRFNRHGDLLTVTGILEDPVYLAEPFVLTQIFRLTTNPNSFPLTACEPIEELPRLHENPALVPHYLPGKHPALNEMTERYNIPLEAVLGGPETMYPEYRKKLKDKYVAPAPVAPGGRGGGAGRRSSFRIGFLVDDFAGLPAPAETVLRPVQRHHAHAMILRVTAGGARDDHTVAHFERLSGQRPVRRAGRRHPTLRCSAPWSRPSPSPSRARRNGDS